MRVGGWGPRVDVASHPGEIWSGPGHSDSISHSRRVIIASSILIAEIEGLKGKDGLKRKDPWRSKQAKTACLLVSLPCQVLCPVPYMSACVSNQFLQEPFFANSAVHKKIIFCFYWFWSKLTRTGRKANQDFHQLITVVDAKFQDTNDDTALPEELSTSGWWSSTAELSAPHRENDCISERCLLKHYRLWNDGLRPGIGPPRRKEGSRRGRPTIVIIATPFQHPFASTSYLCIEICRLNLCHISILRGTFHISLREFFLNCWVFSRSNLSPPIFFSSYRSRRATKPLILNIILE